MGKGSGGGGVAPTPTKSTVTQTSLPEYAEPYYKDLMERGEAESETPYEAYGGPRIAGFDPLQEAGFGMQVESATEAPTGMMGARDYYSGILNQRYPSGRGRGKPGFRSISGGGISGGEGADTVAGSAGTDNLGDMAGLTPSDYQPQIGPRAFEAQDFQRHVRRYDPSQSYKEYMDPYLEDVLGAQRRRGEEVFQEQAQQRSDARVGRGTRRGSRRAIEEAVQRDKYEQRMGDLESKQRSQGYLAAQQQARDQFLRDRASRMEAAQLGGAERLSEAQYGLQAAAAAAGLDPQLFALQQQQAGALQGVGAAQQKMDQANLDLAYQDFLNQRDFDRRQLQFMAGLLQGVPVTPQSEVYQYQAPGSFGGQMAGAGLGALGAYKMLTG
jgi:hypothetical protein